MGQRINFRVNLPEMREDSSYFINENGKQGGRYIDRNDEMQSAISQDRLNGIHQRMEERWQTHYGRQLQNAKKTPFASASQYIRDALDSGLKLTTKKLGAKAEISYVQVDAQDPNTVVGEIDLDADQKPDIKFIIINNNDPMYANVGEPALRYVEVVKK